MSDILEKNIPPWEKGTEEGGAGAEGSKPSKNSRRMTSAVSKSSNLYDQLFLSSSHSVVYTIHIQDTLQ